MRPTPLAMIGALALAAIASPSHAQIGSVTDRADARCILVLAAVARDPQNSAAAAKGTFFYLGRLNGHGLGGKLEPLLLQESKTLAPQQGQAEASRCVGELQTSSTQLQAAFQDLQRLARAAAGPAPARPPGAPPARPPAKPAT